MVETHWDDLRGRQVRYGDRGWELTGDVEVQRDGEVLAVEATRADDVRRGRTRLVFVVEGSGDSLNPGNIGTHFDRLERVDDAWFLVVKTDARTYRYGLTRLADE